MIAILLTTILSLSSGDRVPLGSRCVFPCTFAVSPFIQQDMRFSASSILCYMHCMYCVLLLFSNSMFRKVQCICALYCTVLLFTNSMYEEEDVGTGLFAPVHETILLLSRRASWCLWVGPHVHLTGVHEDMQLSKQCHTHPSSARSSLVESLSHASR